MRRFKSVALPIAMAIQLLWPTSARAQLTDVHGIGDAILNLHNEVSGNQQHVFDNLFSGRIDATILDNDGNLKNFDDGDLVAFSLASTRTSGRATPPLIFSGTRTAFDTWVQANADKVLAILFPASLTESVTGIDVAQHHSQEFLVSTVLASGRGAIGGRLEFESFDVDKSSGNAIQGLFRWNIVAFEGRYAKLQDTADTKSGSLGVNAHPHWKHLGQTTEWRAGADGYFNALISKSAGLDIDALDYGGGPWASFRKEFTRITTTVGGIVLGSDTYIPSSLLGDGLQFLADAVNERALRWDMTLGGAVQGRLTNSVALGGQVLHSQPLKSEADSGMSSELFLVDFIYRLNSGSKLDFGYRFSTGDNQYRAHAVFLNANFAFD